MSNRMGTATAAAVAAFFLTIVVGHFGLTWDEHYIAQGGRLIARGLVPYRDFGIPLGPAIFYLQSLGSIFFEKAFLAYAFPAALLNAGMIYVVTRFTIHYLHWDNKIALAFAFILQCTFFGGAGCLWYNQLAVFGPTLAVALLWLPDRPRRISIQEIGLIGFLTAISITSKPDYAAVGIGILVLTIIAISDRPKTAITQIAALSLTSFTFVALFFLPFYLAGARPHEWLNLGQNGYDNRFQNIPFVASPSIRSLFSTLRSLLETRTLPALFILAFAIARTWARERKLRRGQELIEYWFPVAGLLLLMAGTTVCGYTSGKGGGYLIPHWTALMLLLIAKEPREEFPLKALFARAYRWMLVSLALFSAVCLIYRFKPMFQGPAYVSHGPAVGFISNRQTVDFMEAFDRAIPQWTQERSHPLTVYSSAFYPLQHPLLTEKLYEGPLWPHAGTTMRHSVIPSLVDRIVNDPPDVFFTFGYPESPFAITQLEWGAESGRILSFIKERYEPRLKGSFPVIGSGGGNSRIDVVVHFRVAKSP